ncbi:MAG TPA: hypothetical protein VF507_06410 [Pyrinomonadaceae bacterium]|jgi:hypothetical protein
MSTSILAGKKFYGLLELDAAGTVLYSRVEKNGDGDDPPPDFSGSNFFTEVAPFENIEEFRRRLDGFKRGEVPAQSFTFTCQFVDGPVPVRVLLARIRERSKGGHTKSILVHIRRA